jgi:hypothetical protein
MGRDLTVPDSIFKAREGAAPDAGADDPSADRQRLVSPYGIFRIVDGEVVIATSSEAGHNRRADPSP